MKKKPRKTHHKSTLQNVVLVPITDTKEKSDLDRRRRAAEKAIAVATLDSQTSKTVHSE